MFIIIAPANTHEKHHIRLNVDNIVCYYCEINKTPSRLLNATIIFQLSSPFRLYRGHFDRGKTNTTYVITEKEGNLILEFENEKEMLKQLNEFDNIIKCQKMKEILNSDLATICK